MKNHLANNPVIESSCYIPLNAAILTLLYLQRDCTLPTSLFEMFHELLLCFIAREMNTRQPNRTLGTISSLDDLPRDLKKQLKHISILAYEGVMNNKVVFTQDELPFILPKSSWYMMRKYLISQILPKSSRHAQQDLPAMHGVAEGPVGRNQQQNNLVQLCPCLNPRNACCLSYLPNGIL